jgi:beta-phosphoglucomutase-like phosphatase (HAD superfamily)
MNDPDDVIPGHYDALIFDCDGTLVDTMPAHYAAWCIALATVGITFSEERFYALAGVPTAKIVETLAREQGVSCDAFAVGLAKDRCYVARGHHGPAIDVVVAIARREEGKRKLAVASGNVTDLVMQTLRAAGIDSLFSVVVGADQVAHGKPAPDVFLRAASLLSMPPSRCIVYEDGDPGIEAARAAGMAVVDVRPWLAVPGRPRV